MVSNQSAGPTPLTPAISQFPSTHLLKHHSATKPPYPVQNRHLWLTSY